MAIQYNSNFDETVPFSDVCAQVSMVANTAVSYTVPGNATTRYSVRFGYNASANVFVRLNTAPTSPPGGTVTQQAYGEFRPGGDGSQRYVSGGDILYFITPDVAGGYAGISLRQLPG